MRKTKFMALALVTVLATSTFVSGCGKKADDAKEQATTAEANEYSTDENGDFDSLADATEGEYTIKEQTLIDQDGILIVAKEYIKEDIFGEGLKLYVENNTDKTLEFGCDECTVNGFYAEPVFYKVLNAGEKKDEGFYFDREKLKNIGIDDVGEIGILFNIYDSDTNEDVINPEPVTIKTSAYDGMDTETDIKGDELYNKDGIKVIADTYNEKMDDGSTNMCINLYCENNSGKNVEISAKDISINGHVTDPFFYYVIRDGKKLVSEVQYDNEVIETNKITKLEEVELSLMITDEETLDTIGETKPAKLTIREK